ncbi:hypothetical protein BLNAU_17665 [Blattamonas nauphoetae]|uniref:Uncharacterized protein n=1 Tax=Blattamonas nauphoetae TaxID=2049346 RepID=A0ABQ9X6P5_9EUKA|nr:hypothetical protein BLNAU_17665 [Blattamonas nauphoetae]
MSYPGGFQGGSDPYEMTMLKKENEMLKGQIASLKTEFQREIAEHKKIRDEITLERDLLAQRLIPVREVEDGIVDLYLSIKQPSINTLSKQEQKEEREIHRKLSSLTILGYLRSELTVLFDFKNAFETQTGQTNLAQNQESRRIKGLKNEIEILHARLISISTPSEIADKKIAQNEKECAELIMGAEGTIHNLRNDITRLKEAVATLTSQLREEKNRVQIQKQTINQQQLRLLKITQLDSRLHMMKEQQHADILEISNAHRMEVKEKLRVMRVNHQMELERERLEDALHSTETELKSYKLDFQRKDLLDTKEKLRRCEMMLGKKDERIKSLSVELRHENEMNRVLKKEIEKLTSEYQRLWKSIEKETQEREKRERDRHEEWERTEQLQQRAFGKDKPFEFPYERSLSPSSSPLFTRTTSQSRTHGRSLSTPLSTSFGPSTPGMGRTQKKGESGIPLFDTTLSAEAQILKRVIDTQERELVKKEKERKRALWDAKKTTEGEMKGELMRKRLEEEIAVLKHELGELKLAMKSGGGVQMRELERDAAVSESEAETLTTKQIKALIRRNKILERENQEVQNLRSANEALLTNINALTPTNQQSPHLARHTSQRTSHGLSGTQNHSSSPAKPQPLPNLVVTSAGKTHALLGKSVRTTQSPFQPIAIDSKAGQQPSKERKNQFTKPRPATASGHDPY